MEEKHTNPEFYVYNISSGELSKENKMEEKHAEPRLYDFEVSLGRKLPSGITSTINVLVVSQSVRQAILQAEEDLPGWEAYFCNQA